MHSSLAFAQTTDQSVLVNTDSVKFRVGEPKGWMADVDNAGQFASNVVLYTSLDNVNAGGGMVQITATSKKDLDTAKELEAEIASYNENYPTVKQKDLVTSHKMYKCFSALLYVNGDFYRYITYVNPGDSFKKELIVILNVRKRPATETEIDAYKNIVESLEML